MKFWRVKNNNRFHGREGKEGKKRYEKVSFMFIYYYMLFVKKERKKDRR